MIRTRKFVFLAAFFAVSSLFAYAELNLIDTPMPDTLVRGYYHLYFSSYENGGIKVKVGIGLADRLTLGISEDIGGAIGDGNVQWNIPGVMAKVNIFRTSESGIGWALGYDNFIEGEYGKIVTETNTDGSVKRKEIVYGLYSTFALPLHIFNGNQAFTFGVRFPLLPIKVPKTMQDLTFFAGLNLPINNELRFNLEIENINYNFFANKNTMINASVKYVAGDVLGVSLAFRYMLSKEIPSRSIIIEYQNLFY
jgi:hypothetical protein